MTKNTILTCPETKTKNKKGKLKAGTHSGRWVDAVSKIHATSSILTLFFSLFFKKKF